MQATCFYIKREGLDMYQVNDTIIYGMNGICKIVDITSKSFSGKKSEYYILKPMNSQASTIYVPVKNETLQKISCWPFLIVLSSTELRTCSLKD